MGLSMPRLNTSAIILALFAIGLQVLVTPVIHGTPLRLALADLLLPVVLPVMLVSWIRAGCPWPLAPVRQALLWIAVLTVCLGVSLLIGLRTIGHLETWGLVNKFVGFLVLIAYFTAGAWLAGQATGDNLVLFGRALLGAAWLIATYSLGVCVWYASGVPGWVDLMDRARGLSDNANAYGCLVAVLLLVEVTQAAAGQAFGHRVHVAGMALLMAALAFSGSRSAWLGLAAGLVLLAMARAVNLRLTAAAAAVAIVGSLALSGWGPHLIGQLARLDPTATSVPSIATRPIYVVDHPSVAYDSGVEHRLRLSKQALTMWQNAPIFGQGLGSFLWQQRQSGEPEPSVIHTTALWLLAETGGVGLALFSAFGLFCARSLWRAGSQVTDAAACIITASSAVLLLAVVASIGTEMLYQRHLWFLLGMALALAGARSVAARRENSSS